MKHRQVNGRGVPVPFFVAYIDGKPDFRIADPHKMLACVRRNVCWLCGETLGRNRVFVVGPISTITRTSGEPPSHLECAQYAVKVCPFLIQPSRPYRDSDKPVGVEPPGINIKRNAGVIALWTTRQYGAKRDGTGVLFRMGASDSVVWYAEGRLATRAEVSVALDSGLPLVLQQVDSEEDTKDVTRAYARALNYLPAAPAANQEQACAQ